MTWRSPDTYQPAGIERGTATSTSTTTGTTSRPTSGRGQRESSRILVGLWADIDFDAPGHRRSEARLPLPPTVDAAMDVLHAVGIEPSIVLHTGGGLQVWWILREPLVASSDRDAESLRRTAERWGRSMQAHGERLGYHVDYIGDAARVLRVPGTWRIKSDGDRLLQPMQVQFCRRLSAEPDTSQWVGNRYNLLDLQGAAIAPERPTRAAPVRDLSHGEHGARREGRAGPADAVRSLPWSSILMEFRWEFVGFDGHAELWRRPGASSAYSLRAFDDVAYVWSSNAGIEPGSYTKPDLLAALNGVTLSRLARHIRTTANDRQRA